VALITAFSSAAIASDLKSLIESIGRPRSDRHAVAQNTTVVLYASELCGMTQRSHRYKMDQAEDIRRSNLAGFGHEPEREVKQIVKEVDLWWSASVTSDGARRQLCEATNNSLKRMGY
jgi:hypothetical protein